MIIANIIAYVLLLIGGLNWGLIGIFGFNLVSAIFGTGAFATIIYILVGISAIWLIISTIYNKKLRLCSNDL